MIPILFSPGDGTEHCVGQVQFEDGKLNVEFTPGHEVTMTQFFDIFGNCGVAFNQVIPATNEFDSPRVRSAEIVSWAKSIRGFVAYGSSV